MARGSWLVGAAQRAARCGNPVGGPLFAAVLFTGFRRAALWDGPYRRGPWDRGGLRLYGFCDFCQLAGGFDGADEG